MKAQYNRVSTIEQNAQRQDIEIGATVYLDKCSGSILFKDRKEGSKLLKDVESGNITEIYIHSIDRLGRNTLDIMDSLKWFTDKGVNVISKKEGFSTLNIDGTENMMAKLMIGILGTISEFEYNRLKERQSEGIAKAKERGAYKGNGRPSGTKLTNQEFLNKKTSKDVLKRLKQGHSLRDTAKLCKCSLSTVQKVQKTNNFLSEGIEIIEERPFLIE
jgi:DNA invertase Pin-like site-specific DNA recombinase